MQIEEPRAKRRAPARNEEIPRPFLKTVGGKKRLLKELERHVPPSFGDYYEPFVAGGALFWHLLREGKLGGEATLNDKNHRLIRAYRGIRDSVGEVIAKLNEHAACHGREHFDRMRKAFKNEAFAPAGMAAWLLYMNRAGFNGLFRVNRKGQFNTPFGDGSPIVIDEENLRACSRALAQGWIKLFEVDFADAVAPAKRGDFVYFDPPYVPVSKTASFTSYTADGFAVDDQRRLADRARELKEHGVHVLLTNSDAPLVRQLYPEPFWSVRRVAARGDALNSDPSKRGRVGELIIS